MSQEYAVRYIEVSMARKVCWVSATSEKEAEDRVRELLRLGYDKDLHSQVESYIVEPTQFDLTVSKVEYKEDTNGC